MLRQIHDRWQFPQRARLTVFILTNFIGDENALTFLQLNSPEMQTIKQEENF